MRQTHFLYAAALLLVASDAFAPPYTIDWWTVAGGGGTSTAGVYTVNGTMGQPGAAGPSTNSQYYVTGGFWALPRAIQVEGAPMLTIAPAAPGQATLAWTPNAPGFVLQETWGLPQLNWTNALSGATNPVVVTITLPTKYYRLKK